MSRVSALMVSTGIDGATSLTAARRTGVIRAGGTLVRTSKLAVVSPSIGCRYDTYMRRRTSSRKPWSRAFVDTPTIVSAILSSVINFAERILIGEIEARHAVVDDRDAGGTLVVRLVEIASEEKRNSDVREVTGTHLVEAHDTVCLRRRRVPFDRHAGARFGTAEETVFGERRRGDAGYGADALEEPDADPADVVADVSGGDGVDAHQDHVLRLVAEVLRLHVVERAREEPRTHAGGSLRA